MTVPTSGASELSSLGKYLNSSIFGGGFSIVIPTMGKGGQSTKAHKVLANTLFHFDLEFFNILPMPILIS